MKTTQINSALPVPKRIVFVVGLLFSLSLASCHQESEVIAPGQPGQTPTETPLPAGAITPVATPQEGISTATIGPAGGIIESIDKRIRVHVPAGALTTSQVISVQPLSQNHCPLGTGQAYRLLPHGLTFAKAATLTIQYHNQDVKGTTPQLLRIAYQTNKGHWQSPATTGIDTLAHTISVQTTHFSDWGLFQTMTISPDQAFISPGEHVKLNVLQVPLTKYGDELLVPIPTRIESQYVEKWALQGEGSLVHQHNTGDYYAPAHIPATNPAAVTVFLNKSVTMDGKVFKDLRLVANVLVAPEGISIQVSGGKWETYQGGAGITASQSFITGRSGAMNIVLGWTGSPTGTYPWAVSGGASYINIRRDPNTFHYQHVSPGGVSSGYLQVSNEDETWVVGTFYLSAAWWIDTLPHPPLMGTSPVTGVFRVKRTL